MDHALLIASKVCAALEYAHARKNETGARFPRPRHARRILVSYEGEVRLRGFGYWPSRVRDAGLLPEAESRPRSRAGRGARRPTIRHLRPRGRPVRDAHRPAPARGLRHRRPRRRRRSCRTRPETTTRCPSPSPTSCSSSLAADPAARYADVREMRKAIDTLLFAGDFTPTTFNLAFFMHSLFRDDMEREAQGPQGGEGGQLRRVPRGDGALRRAAARRCPAYGRRPELRTPSADAA